MNKSIKEHLMLALLSLGLITSSPAQTSAFTYQGVLSENGAPTSGLYDMQFALFDDAIDGAQIGETQVALQVEVKDGLFTVSLEFGFEAWNGSARWLAIGLRPSGSATQYVMLSSRHPITTTPYAVRASQFSGAISDAQLSGNIPRLDSSNLVFTGAVDFTHPESTFRGIFSGDGAELENLNSLNLTGPLTIADQSPVLVGHVPSQNPVAEVAVVDHFAYVYAEEQGIIVYDVASPATPVRVGEVQDSRGIRRITVSGNYAYAAGHVRGLSIYDVSNPSLPVLAGSTNNGGGAMDVAISGQYAYVANGKEGLWIYDVSDPTHPAYVSHIDVDGEYPSLSLARGVAVQGNYAFVAHWYGGLRIYDISNPSNPIPIGHHGDGVYPWWDVAAVGNSPYVVGGTRQGFQVYNVSDPSNPVLVAQDSYSRSIVDVEISGDYAYSASSRGLLIYDVSDLTNPILMAQAQDGEPGVRSANAVAVSDQYAYVANGGDGLRVYALQPTTAQTFAGNFNGRAQGTFIGDGSNLSNLNATSLTGFLTVSPVVEWGNTNNGGTPWDVVASGNFTYLANGNDGLRVYDVSDPATPSNIGHVNNGGVALGVAMAEPYLLLANGQDGLRVYDISDPSLPTNIGHGLIVDFIEGIAVAGNRAYLGGHSNGLWIYDISNPASPNPLGFTGNGAWEHVDRAFPVDVAVSGSYAYLATFRGGLHIYDVSAPTTPALVASLTNDIVESVFIDGNEAYLTTDTGFQIYDVTNPSNPTEVAAVNLFDQFESRTYTWEVAVSGAYAFVASGTGGLQVFDVSDPTQPVTVEQFSDFDFFISKAVTVSGNYVYLASEDDGLRTFALGVASAPVFRGNFDGRFTGSGSGLTDLNGLHLQDGTVTTSKIADDAIDSSKIMDGTVSTPDLANGAVTEIKLADGAVTAAKLGDEVGVWSKVETNLVYGGGNVGIANGDPTNLLMVANARCDGNSWINASDRNLKENFAHVNTRQVLEKLLTLPLQTWNYREQSGQRHLGPFAQDFRASFGLGSDDKSIATVDSDGVVMAALQGLNQKLEEQSDEKDAEIVALKQRLVSLEQLIHKLTAPKQ